ncbi:hypothetical protein [Lysobacter gummosus]|uniref:hypothetical protein n=1 Tax=Lysobacter gummosus TaxID=262324 RepID=UPI0036389176
MQDSGRKRTGNEESPSPTRIAGRGRSDQPRFSDRRRGSGTRLRRRRRQPGLGDGA